MSSPSIHPSHRDVSNLAAVVIANPNSQSPAAARAECGVRAGFAVGPVPRSATPSANTGVVSLSTPLLSVGRVGLPPFAAPATRLPVTSDVPTLLATSSRLHTHGHDGFRWQTSSFRCRPRQSFAQVE